MPWDFFPPLHSFEEPISCLAAIELNEKTTLCTNHVLTSESAVYIYS